MPEFPSFKTAMLTITASQLNQTIRKRTLPPKVTCYEGVGGSSRCVPLHHFLMTNFAIHAVAIADGQLSIAHSVDCPAVRAVKHLTGAHFPRSRHRCILPEVLESASVNTLLLVALVGWFRHERALPHVLQCYFRKSFPGLRGCKPLISCRLLNRPPRQRNPYAGRAIQGRYDKLTVEGDRNAADCARSLAGVVLHRIQESARSWLSDPTGCRLYWRQRTQKSAKGNYRGALNTLGRD
jgi:hypothetical protein